VTILTENNNGIDILSIDAKDIYIANNYLSSNTENHLGYNIRYEKGENAGSINIKKFINKLDYSLELIKLREVYEKVYRNTAFTFMQNGHEYTTKVINVTFKYSNKEFNKVKKDTYVKFGYNINELVFKDHVCLENNELVAIEINQDVETPITNDKLGKYFYFDNNQYHAKSIPTVNSKCDLRKELYKNGFYCDGFKYVRYKRSSGSSRVGKCLFIDEKLYSRMHKWEMCGIKIKEGQECDLAALEAYIALTLSSIIDTIEINPENILIIDDYESVFSDNVIETKLNGNWLESKENTMTIKNSIWDGQSLMDISLFGNYINYGMLLLRNRFFKSCCFNTNIQEWFKNNKITNISQLNGYTIAKDIKDIKLITTPSSIKYLKFGKKEEWINNIEPLFGVVKHEKKTHNFDGRMVQTHYQLLNTLQLSEFDMRKFLKPSLDYLKLLKNDPSVVRYYIKYPENIKFKITPLTSKNDIVYKLLGINDKFAKTKLYYDFKNDLTKSFVKNLRCGHVLVNGNYSTLLSCPIEMLQSAINKFNGDSILGVGNIHSKNFEYNKKILCSRSPHVTIGNILITNNIDCDIIDKYCNLTNEIVCINTINENILERLSSADMDSDTMLMTDNNILVNTAIKNYFNFKVPTNNVESIKKNRKYISDEKADLDFKTSDNKIGEIINLSQELNTILWDEVNNGAKISELQDLYNDICQLDVMSCIEIDKAKKEFIVNTYNEMKKIRSKWIKNDDDGRMIKPNFFGHLARTKGYYDSKKKNYKKHDTSMDYLQKIINQFQLARNNVGESKNKFIPFSSIINMDGYDIKKVYYDQIKRVIDLITQSSIEIINIYNDINLAKEEKYKMTSEIRQKRIEYIGNLRFSKSTMIYLLLLCDMKEYKNISSNILNTLFGYPNTLFYQIIKDSIEPLEILVENNEGNVDVYGYKFVKTYKN
jgi:hypothetical protein